jgi:hypothetical protein
MDSISYPAPPIIDDGIENFHGVVQRRPIMITTIRPIDYKGFSNYLFKRNISPESAVAARIAVIPKTKKEF